MASRRCPWQHALLRACRILVWTGKHDPSVQSTHTGRYIEGLRPYRTCCSSGLIYRQSEWKTRDWRHVELTVEAYLVPATEETARRKFCSVFSIFSQMHAIWFSSQGAQKTKRRARRVMRTPSCLFGTLGGLCPIQTKALSTYWKEKSSCCWPLTWPQLCGRVSERRPSLFEQPPVAHCLLLAAERDVVFVREKAAHGVRVCKLFRTCFQPSKSWFDRARGTHKQENA